MTRSVKAKQMSLDEIQAILGSANAQKMEADVRRLCRPRNQYKFSQAMSEASEFLVDSFGQALWKVQIQDFSIQVPHDRLRPYITEKLSHVCENPILTGRNIIARKEGANSSSTIVIGAHYDTVSSSPGADDNTASVAGLLELARLLGPHQFNHTILLVAFDMEEIHFAGSEAFLEQTLMTERIAGAVVFETMAYTDTASGSQHLPPATALLFPTQTLRIRKRRFAGDWTMIAYRKSSHALARTIGDALVHTAGDSTAILFRDPLDNRFIGRFLRFFRLSSDFGRSDHVSFWKAGIPAIMITDTGEYRNPHYHQITDTPDTLNYNHLSTTVTATAMGLAQLQGLVMNR